jgi:ribosomal-protein-alanine N-acetyltransferase
MTITRPAVSGDIDQIDAMERAYSQNPWTRDGIASGLANPNAIFFVVENDENRIVAYAFSALVLDELHIQEIAVAPDCRNRGLGASLINLLIQTAAAKNAKRAYLEVRRSNHTAIRLYERYGFVKEAVRTAGYTDGEDAVFMGLRFAD